VANESRLDVVDGRRRRSLASCAAAVPLTWLAMFRSSDLVLSSRSVRFTTEWETARARLDDPRGLCSQFGSYGDISPHASALSDTLAAHVAAGGPARGSVRISIDVREIAGERPDPRAWARALGAALDALDAPAPAPAPMTPPELPGGGLTEIDKIRQLRLAADLGIGEARARLREHGGDLQGALDAVEADKSPEQRARDQAGAFVARLVRPQDLPPRPSWQVLLEASALEYGETFPPADLLLQSSRAPDRQLRTHGRLLGESVDPGAVSWEPGYRWA
jgi:hypothetical protein